MSIPKPCEDRLGHYWDWNGECCSGEYVPEEKKPNVSGARKKDAWFHLCWELGIQEPFYADQLDVYVTAINTIRQLRRKVDE